MNFSRYISWLEIEFSWINISIELLFPDNMSDII